MKLFKIIAAIIFSLGLILFMFSFTDIQAGGLGRTLILVGAFFIVGGLLLYGQSLHDVKLATIARSLSDLDTTLSLPSVKIEPSIQKQKNFPPSSSSLPSNINVAAQNEEPHKRDYFNELANYLEPLPEKNLEPLPEKNEVSHAASLPIEEPKPIVAKPKLKQLNEITSDFPELDAILNKKEPVKNLVEPEPIHEQHSELNTPHQPSLAPALIREGSINGVNFRLFSDGTIDADFSNGSHKFATLAEFRAYVDPK